MAKKHGQSGKTKQPAAVEKEATKPTRKRPYTAADLMAVQQSLLAFAGRFEGLALRLKEEGVPLIQVEGKLMLERGFDSIGLFLANADAGLTRAKADLRRGS